MVGFPLLLIPIAVYNLVVWLMPGVSLNDTLFTLTLLSGQGWAVNLGDILLAAGVLLLLLEIIKGARPGSKYLTDHLLSLIVFGGAAAEFVMLPKFGTSTFFLLALMAMVDFVGGIALHARRRALPAVERPAAEVPAEVHEPEPRVEPVPAAPAPAKSPADESWPTEDARLKPSPPAEPSPTIPSPGLQPGTGSSPSPGTPN